MRALAWLGNAVGRTARGLHPAWADPDDAWAKDRLRADEYALYLCMDPRDRRHAVDLTRALLRRHPNASTRLVRAALLHDVGKARRPYVLLERILVHLLPARAEPPATPLRRGLRGARQLQAHHPSYGAAMIRGAAGDPRVAELVERHHRPGGDPEADLLHALDERT